MGIYSTLNIGRDALLTQQRAIEVTGHNIANVNTPGYSRQRLVLSPRDPIPTWAGQLGTGVQGIEVERIIDRYLGDQINSSAQDLGRWEAQKSALERVEVTFDETTGYGINNAMSEFWNAWQDVVNNPSGDTQRNLLVAMGENLTNTFNSVYSDLADIRNDLDSSISNTVTEINRLASEIADLNDKIESIEGSGQNSNDYRDERDQVLRELSGLINFTSSEGSSGAVTITLGDGNNLVSGTNVLPLTATDTDGDGFLDIAWSSSPATAINADITGGKLSGWMEARDVIIVDYLNRLDLLATTLMSELNTIHSLGYGLDGNTSRDFFTGTGASDISVDSLIVNNPSYIAAAYLDDGLGALPGDNRNAIAIVNLQNGLTMNGGTATFDDFYNSVISDVGIEVSNADSNYEHQYSMSAQLDNYRESISGVSLDEEMVNLIKFQHAYNAAAKLITTVDELMDALIAMI